MSTTLGTLAKILAAILLIGTIVFLVVKYIDAILGLFYTIKRRIFGCKCDDEYYDDDEDIDLSGICLDTDCTCNEG